MREVASLNIEVCTVCDEHKMVTAEKGLPLEPVCKSLEGVKVCDIKEWMKGDYAQELAKEGGDAEIQDTDLDKMAEFLDTMDHPHKVLIDCTASDKVPNMYAKW